MNTRKGMIGAILSEYEIALTELKKSIADVTESEMTTLVEPQAKNPNCVSIQVILDHVLLCGYDYLTYIDIDRGNINSSWRDEKTFTPLQEYPSALDQLLADTTIFFENFSDKEMNQYDPSKKIKTGWGQLYDYEQMMEHAVMHIYRHRRQIEGFKLRLKN